MSIESSASPYPTPAVDSARNLSIAEQVRMYEDATKFGEYPNFQVIAEDGVAT